MNQIVVPAPAKINLALDILGVRSDGYHEVEMIMQSISLHDNIIIKKKEEGIKLATSNLDLPEDENNIAYKAARLIIDKAELTEGVDIYIEKNIPVAGGLAGGSTDAAAVLNGINMLYNLDLSEDELKKLASKLGSDVPFCIRGGTALAYGRGEMIRQLPDIEKQYLVLVNPGISISTAWAYSEYDKGIQRLKIPGVPVDKLTSKLTTDKKINWAEGWFNVLEEVAESFYPEIIDIKELLNEMGAIFTLMSGSGSTVFAVVNNLETAGNIRENWPRSDDYITTAWTVKEDFSELWRK
ncbi:MAG: 4-(cytidine 5'-diphospho)-2-C-methyl-D-erythritol kinase [Halanaerobiales bacterium]